MRFHIVCILVLFQQLNCQLPESPCPEIFEYSVDSEHPGQYDARIRLFSTITVHSMGVDVWFDKPFINVNSANTAVQLVTASRVFIGFHKATLIANTSYIFSLTINYIPNSDPPILLTLRLNGITICGEDIDAPCGTRAEQIETEMLTNMNNLDQGVQEGEFPWHAGLYDVNGFNFYHLCGATLISPLYVITVAQCVTRVKSEVTLNPDNLIVYLGKYYFKTFSNRHIQELRVSHIIAHPQYHAQTYTNNIALVKFRNPAKINNYVRPICLWKESTDLSSVLYKQGNIVGWGLDQMGTVAETIIQSKMIVVSPVVCPLFSSPELCSPLTSSNTYWAVFKNGTTLCNGEFGSGMIYSRPGSKPNRLEWQLRGLVFSSLELSNQFNCGGSHYLVLTDVAKYIPWIKKSAALDGA